MIYTSAIYVTKYSRIEWKLFNMLHNIIHKILTNINQFYIVSHLYQDKAKILIMVIITINFVITIDAG